MDSTIDLFIKRADNELVLTAIVNRISQETSLKKDVFKIAEELTFYSAVIEHAYYAIFHSAKAYLISQGITFANKQGQHQKVYHKFRLLVKKDVVDKSLLAMYEEVKGRADELLGILHDERKKRGEFTYEKLPQANREPAEQSLINARHFVSHIKSFIEKHKEK